MVVVFFGRWSGACWRSTGCVLEQRTDEGYLKRVSSSDKIIVFRMFSKTCSGRDQDGPLLRFFSQSASAVRDYILSPKSVWKIVPLPVILDPFSLRMRHK